MTFIKLIFMTYFPPISSIIAHIDHGKSTLADRLLEYVGAIDNRSSTNQRILDNLKVEKDRGITVKAQTASVIYKVCTGVRLVIRIVTANPNFKQPLPAKSAHLTA